MREQAVETAPERCGDKTRLRGLALHPQGASNLVRVGGLCGPQALRRANCFQFNRPLPRTHSLV